MKWESNFNGKSKHTWHRCMCQTENNNHCVYISSTYSSKPKGLSLANAWIYSSVLTDGEHWCSVVVESPASGRYTRWAGKTGKTGQETDYVGKWCVSVSPVGSTVPLFILPLTTTWVESYVVSRYSTPPRAIHPHQIATILEESV